MSSKKFILTAQDKAFDANKQANNISDLVVPYSKKIAEATSIASELDRYDDFADLKIDINSYERPNDKWSYGIVRQEEVHGNSHVILKHQKDAAHAFLKELRGFGLLADIVGSGKTYEASIVLSELASRGKINSMIIIAPSGTIGAWTKVIEQDFGLGKNKLVKVTSSEQIKRKKVDSARPLYPIIVSLEDFAQWSVDSIENLLFDAVVVDEAHNLCNESGDNAKAMMLLSYLMQVKKKYNSTYCTLLSATPHSGNLETMFRLWYFIRCKGGNPKDFEEKEDRQRSDSYLREKHYYTQSVCRGATTVAEYIAVSKQYELEGLSNDDGSVLHHSKFKQQYEEFALKQLRVTKTSTTYARLAEGQKRILRDQFLNSDEDIRNKVLANIANSYHNGLMRSIMIRQPRSANKPKKRSVENIFFFPVDNIVEQRSYNFRGYDFVVNCQDMSVSFVNSRGASVNRTLFDFAKYIDTDNAHDTFSELLVSRILGEMGSFDNKNFFTKANSQRYYWEQLRNITNEDISTTVKLVDSNQDDLFYAKYAEFVNIAKSNPTSSILVFFDYELGERDKEYQQWDRLYDALKLNNSELLPRIIQAKNSGTSSMSGEQKAEIIDLFNQQPGAIMLVGTADLTEGINLQTSNIAVNFQVTPDPQAMDQRIGRIHRLGQKNDVRIISLAAMNRLEGYALAYLNRIGIMHSSSNDASIIAGSNDDLIAIQCPACKKVELLSTVEYNERKANSTLVCNSYERCIRDGKGTAMAEINIHEFKCDHCGAQLVRGQGEEGYRCFATNNTTRDKLSNISGTRSYHCSKICILRNCKRFKQSLADKCAIMLKYARKPIVLADCKRLCLECEYLDKLCPKSCSMLFDNSLDSIRACLVCNMSDCSPKPSLIEFDEMWNAKCPNCSKGTLRQKKAKTFSAYIRAAFDFNVDNGESFCDNLLKEARKTDDIKRVLENDQL